MKIIKTKFLDLKIIKLKKNKDTRGNLVETFRKKNFKKNNLIFDYKVFSKKNVIRGFHFQHRRQQAKQIIVLKGKILDCVIDLRKKSKTFGKSFKIFLSEKNNLSLYVPRGFAHSYLTLDKENIVYYKLSNYYYPKYENGIMWDDKDLNINWPVKKPKISFKDKNLLTYKNFLKKFKHL
jgi:dTDP-4-dehydrorhamnose 3,5-epimerase